MRLRILTFITLTILLSIGLMTTLTKEQGRSLDNITSALSNVQDTLFNITSNDIEYKNPYADNFTITDFALNIAHGALYSMVVEINTLLGISVVWFYNHVEFMQMVFITKLLVFLSIAWVLSKSVIPVGAIYVFYEDMFEQKKKKIKKYWILGLAIATWLVILGLLLILIFLIW